MNSDFLQGNMQQYDLWKSRVLIPSNVLLSSRPSCTAESDTMNLSSSCPSTTTSVQPTIRKKSTNLRSHFSDGSTVSSTCSSVSDDNDEEYNEEKHKQKEALAIATTDEETGSSTHSISSEEPTTFDYEMKFSNLSHLDLMEKSTSPQICEHFLKGKCRFRGKCRKSHSLSYCVYCSQKLPINRVIASQHLSHCWKANRQN